MGKHQITKADQKGARHRDADRVSVLIAHDEAFVGESLAQIVRARGCKLASTTTSLDALLTLDLPDEPDIGLIGDLEDLSMCLVGFDSWIFDHDQYRARALRVRQLGLDGLIPACLSEPQIALCLQKLITGQDVRAHVGWLIGDGALSRSLASRSQMRFTRKEVHNECH